MATYYIFFSVKLIKPLIKQQTMIIALIKHNIYNLKYNLVRYKKGEISVNAIIGIVILIITLFILLAIIVKRGERMQDIWVKSPFG